MGRFAYLIWSFGLSLLLFSCAQVGQIDGGQKDTYAPRPKTYKPENENIHFNGRKISITFDEYFTLNNPIENIQLTPNNLKIHSKIDKKTLTLDLEGDLLPNTTYQLMLNNVVKDVHEGNDTLLQYVFSTGNYIDSLIYAGKVIDAYEGSPASQYVVGLYPTNDSIEKVRPRYYTKTDKTGKFQLKYLREGEYKVVAFLDFNNDLKYQASERVAFKDQPLQLTKSFNDSITPLMAFKNEQTRRVISKNFYAPRLVKIAANTTLKQTRFFYENQQIDTSAFFYYSTDSLAILLPTAPTADFTLIAQTDNVKDSISFSYPLASLSKKMHFESFPRSNDISSSKSVMLVFPDDIEDFKEEKIKAIITETTSLPMKITVSKNIVSLDFPDTLKNNINLLLDPEAFKFKSGNFSEKTGFTFTCKAEREFGSITLKPVNLSSNYLVEFLLNGKVTHTITSKSIKDAARVRYLNPGEYTFRVIFDANGNGKWDVGNISEKRQAERVLHFKEKTVVRANWETEVELEVAQ